MHPSTLRRAGRRYVFSREAFDWERLDRARIELIAPVIDAFSAKNQDLDRCAVGAILRVAGLNEGAGGAGDATFIREDGTPAAVRATCAAAGSTAVVASRKQQGGASPIHRFDHARRFPLTTTTARST